MEKEPSPSIDSMTIEELQSSISMYESNLIQIESSISLLTSNSNPDNQDFETTTKIKELQNLAKDVKNAIAFFKSTLLFKTEPLRFNDQPITVFDKSKAASIYYEKEKTWYNGIINSVDEKNKICNVTFFGYNETDTLPFKYIKIHPEIEEEYCKTGIKCDAIYKEDGKWYEAEIWRVSDLGVHVKFIKYGNEEILSKDSIRITPKQKVDNWNSKKGKDDRNKKFIIPEKYRLNPNDSEEVKLLKRKRVKNLKNKNKQKEIELIAQEKQQKWLNFSKTIKHKKV